MTMDLPWIKLFMDTRRTEADKIQADWSQKSHNPSDDEDEVKRAALLAWEGHLTSVGYMRIAKENSRDIPLDHMEKLASIVTERVTIAWMTHTDQLGSILASVKCPVLELYIINLSEAETQALVTAMRDRVQCVRFWYYGCVNINELTQYDGQGRCSWIEVGFCTGYYEERLRRWAADKGWTLTLDNDGGLVMKRKQESNWEMLRLRSWAADKGGQ